MKSILLVLALISAVAVRADIAPFSESLKEWHVRVIRSLEMFGTEDPPAKGPPGNGQAYIKVIGTISTDGGEAVTGHLQPFFIEGDTLDYIGQEAKDNQGTWYCCDESIAKPTPPQVAIPGCGVENINQLVVKPEYKDLVHIPNPVYINNASSAPFTTEFSVTRNGVYILMFANCDPTMFYGTKDWTGNATMIWIEGTSVWMNPYGYLPGRLYGFLPFYGWMTVFTVAAGVIWLLLNVMFWKEVVTVQHFISGMLVVLLIEVATWYGDYRNFNQTGQRHTGVVVFGILMSVCRMTFSRLLVVAVSVGFGVVKPDLGKNKLRLIILGLLYFSCETALELVIRYGQTNAVAQKWRFFLSFPVAVLNAMTYWWIFFSLYKLTAQLTVRKQLIKLQLYKRFSSVLLFSLVAAVAFALYQMYYLYAMLQTVHWSLIWLLDGGFSLILYTLVLFSIAVLWRPNSNSHRYAYAQVNRSDEEEDFGLDGAPTGGVTGGGGGDGSVEFSEVGGSRRGATGPDTMDDEPPQPVVIPVVPMAKPTAAPAPGVTVSTAGTAK